MKDINDLDRLHGYRRGGATVTLVLHNNHEEVTAGNLLNDKRPEKEREREREQCHVCLFKCRSI